MTYTQENRIKIQAAKAVILTTYKMTELQHKMLLFDMGLEFARRMVAQSTHWVEEDYRYLTTNVESGYWAWWRYRWGMDDVFLSLSTHLGKYPYRRMKQDLIELEGYYKEANKALKMNLV